MERQASFIGSISSYDAKRIEENLARSTRLTLEKEIYDDEKKDIMRLRRNIRCYKWLINTFKVITILVTLASGITGLITDNLLVVKISSAIYLCTTALAAASVWAEKNGTEVQRQLNKKLSILKINDWKEDVFPDSSPTLQTGHARSAGTPPVMHTAHQQSPPSLPCKVTTL